MNWNHDDVHREALRRLRAEQWEREVKDEMEAIRTHGASPALPEIRMCSKCLRAAGPGDVCVDERCPIQS